MTRLLLAVVPASAAGADGTRFLYDARGRAVGSVTTFGNRVVFFDGDGVRVGSMTTLLNGVTIYPRRARPDRDIDTRRSALSRRAAMTVGPLKTRKNGRK